MGGTFAVVTLHLMQANAQQIRAHNRPQLFNQVLCCPAQANTATSYRMTSNPVAFKPPNFRAKALCMEIACKIAQMCGGCQNQGKIC